jgi:broad specificity phosphatase PhoE
VVDDRRPGHQPAAPDGLVIASRPTLAHAVWLVRHAETDWTGVRWCGRADPELSPDGRRAAEAVAIELAREISGRRGLPALFVSPARRAQQTAACIAALIGVSAAGDPDLLEVDVGVAEGLTWTELERRHPKLAAEVARGIQPDWPGGETRTAIEARAGIVADRIRAAAIDQDVVVVSHGGILHAVATLLGDDGNSFDPLLPAGVQRFGPR